MLLFYGALRRTESASVDIQELFISVRDKSSSFPWIPCSCSPLFRWRAWKIFSLIPVITPGPKMHSSTLNTSDGSVIPKLSNRSFRRPREAKVGESYDIWVIFVVFGECNDSSFGRIINLAFYQGEYAMLYSHY